MKVLELYRAGKVLDPALTPSFQQFEALEKQIAERESEKKAIEAEGTTPPVQPQPAPAAAPQAYGHLCSKDRTPIPGGAAFCPRCGAPAIDVAPPAPPQPQPASATCAKCGATVPAGAAFCPECGTAQSRPAS
jgi:membrane protease subunit (stomatin/prohibitin family)